ncbi:unnamed protein product [Darwinula stevensoni]|uniref:Uncharacterized protein n=1 Tax=Darwinula stevensoni TaxID=69355 RepID=A0A7R8XGQ7_9CRUS|nr:unnamed protein product [Darwinula stevensoni]CAG0892756.1 unnamed protein product [Darwinula stevensoni]
MEKILLCLVATSGCLALVWIVTMCAQWKRTRRRENDRGDSEKALPTAKVVPKAVETAARPAPTANDRLKTPTPHPRIIVQSASGNNFIELLPK